MNFPHQKDPRTQAEFFGFAISVSAFVTLMVWQYYGFVHPPCLFRSLTGWPCPTCFGTHALMSLLEGKIGEAFVENPLVILCCAVAGLYTLYAAHVLFLKRSALRWHFSEKHHRGIRILLIATILANWIYLIGLSHS